MHMEPSDEQGGLAAARYTYVLLLPPQVGRARELNPD